MGFTLSLGFQFWGTRLSNAHNGGLITSASPAFIVLFAYWLLREGLTWQKGLALGLATVGVLAVIGPESASEQGGALWLGNLCLVGAAVTWALYTVMGKIATLHYSSLTVSVYATLSGLVFTTPVAYLTEWRTWSPGPLPALVLLCRRCPDSRRPGGLSLRAPFCLSLGRSVGHGIPPLAGPHRP